LSIILFPKVPVDEAYWGHFFDGDSYIILYTYEVSDKFMDRSKQTNQVFLTGTAINYKYTQVEEIKHYIIYFWQGRHSSLDEIGSSAFLTVELDDELG